MSTLTIPKLASQLIFRPIVISMNSLALSSLMSYVMSANGNIDWRSVCSLVYYQRISLIQLSSQITICVASDILAMGADHLKDKEEEFLSDRKNAYDPRLASWFVYARIFLTASAVLLALTLSLCPLSTLLTTAAVLAPALLWNIPISFNMFGLISRHLLGRFVKDSHHQPSTPPPTLVIKRVPGMKAIFSGVIRGCGIYAIVLSVLSGSGNLADTLPSPWSTAQLIVWSTVNRSCHAAMNDVRDFDDDLKAGVPTIPVLLRSVRKTKVILTACHMLVMLAFIENQYIIGSCLFATALVWILDKHSPKKAFLLGSHSQSLFIIWYFLTRNT
ncbi:hypothetical protein DEU56DRAFT_806469 [Suillus clintonianus]|uniref:uncharacterized protein n=1 Tax=Suillus clintonianus TaxID=1904413 RepID=UPI001B85BAE3|nr:uncharacterized protein DEU56DRAFT_806469 [Suillus clintonianus]KAG2135785.1 hypothetical protein DEU56DRAFT_806469 [Suillus clintonianus]